MAAQLSVAIITRDEERNLDACLRSVGWANEIVVVDSGSTDRTREIARGHGARVIETADWPGFGAQKNRAIDACAGEWILVLDADERITDASRAEIQSALADPGFDVYEMPRKSTYCGHFIRHSGWWPDHVRRLFRRSVARYSDARVHENLLTDRPIGRLRSPLLHYSFRSAEQVLGKVNRYSSEGAQMLIEQGRMPGLASAVLHGLAAFFRTYVLKLGVLDGRYGFMLAVSNAEGSYYRYVKAMLAAQKKRDDAE